MPFETGAAGDRLGARRCLHQALANVGKRRRDPILEVIANHGFMATGEASSLTTPSWVHAIQPRRSPLGAASGISGHDGSYGLTSTTAGAAIRCSLSARRRDHGSMRISNSTPSIMRRDEMAHLRTRRIESTASARRSVVRSHCCRNADSAALFSGLFISATSRRAISGSFTAQSGSEIRRASKLISSGAMNSRRARNSRTSPASISATGRPRPQASTAAITAS